MKVKLPKVSFLSRPAVWAVAGLCVVGGLAGGAFVLQSGDRSIGSRPVAKVAQAISPIATAEAAPLAVKQGVSLAWFSPDHTRFQMCPAAQDAASYNQPVDQVFEGDTGWFFRAGEISPEYGLTNVAMHDLVRQLRAYLDRSGTRLIVLVPPPRMVLGKAHLGNLVHNAQAVDIVESRYQKMLASLRADGALVPDVLGEGRRRHLDQAALTDPGDIHWTPLGALTAAQATARIVRADPRVKAAPVVQYELARNGPPFAVRGLRGVLDKLCGVKSTYPKLPSFAPPKKMTSGQSLLGGGDKAASIVVVGTSFSAMEFRFNFPGFLGAATGADVVNLSITGGGNEQALAQYLSSGALQRDRPDFLIWEFPPSNLPNTDTIDQLRAMLTGSCSKGVKVVHAFDWTESEIVGPHSIADVPNGPVDVFIKSSNPALKKFSIRARRYDGFAKKYSVDFSRTASPPSTFAFHFENLNSVRSIAIEPADMIAGQVTTTICPSST